MLRDIKRIEGSNPGGNCYLQYAPAFDLLSYPVATAGIVTGDFEFLAGKGMYLVETVENKLSYDEEPAEDANGEPCAVSIKAMIRGDIDWLRPLLSEMMRIKKHVVKCRDNAGITRVIGNKDQQLSFRYKFSTGDGMSTMRSATIEFYGAFLSPPPVMA